MPLKQQTSWPEKRRVGRPSLVAVDEIVDAALRVIQRIGLEKFTMRQLANELGMSTMAAYHHIRTKERLLDLVIDRLFSDIPLPPIDASRWEDLLRENNHTVRRMLARYPGLGSYLLRRVTMTPGGSRVFEWFASLMLAAGFEEADVVESFAVSRALVLGSLPDHPQSLRRRRGKGRRPVLPRDVLKDERFPALQRIAKEIEELDRAQIFALGLDRFLEGLRLSLEHRKRKGS